MTRDIQQFDTPVLFLFLYSEATESINFIYVIWKLWVSSFFLSTKTLSGDEPVAAADDKFASSVSNEGWLSWFKGMFLRSEIANRNKINLFSDVKLKMSTRFVSQMQ